MVDKFNESSHDPLSQLSDGLALSYPRVKIGNTEDIFVSIAWFLLFFNLLLFR